MGATHVGEAPMNTRLRLMAPVTALLATLVSTASATEWTVCASGCDFATIQDAVSASVTGDSIAVKAGTYTGSGPAVVDIGSKGLIINANDGPSATFIDGQSARTCLYVHPSGGNESTIKGFTFVNGVATTGGRGGGVHIESASPIIRNCIFQNNQADDGGGLHIEGTSSPALDNCQFLNNHANVNGGGAFNRSSDAVTFTDCDFDGNEATIGGGGGLHFTDLTSGSVNHSRFNLNQSALGGGGVFLGSNTVVAFTLCDFLSNQSGDHGGGVYTNSHETSFDQCIFKANIAANVGGGLYVYGGLLVTVNQCSFNTNSAHWGGGIGNYTSSPTITTCHFFANQATNGGAIHNHKALPFLDDCSITGNQAHLGAAGYDLDSDPHFNNCLIEGNQANDGGAFYEYQSRAFFALCTIQSNTAAGSGGGMYVSTGMWAPRISASLFRDNAASTDGGAIESDSTDVVVIDNTRFCGNTTDHISVGTLYTTDAFTYFLDDCPDCIGDATGDWVVDIEDFSVLLVEFGGTGDLASDHDGDGDVDVSDFSELLIHFGEDCWDESPLRSAPKQSPKQDTKIRGGRRS